MKLTATTVRSQSLQDGKSEAIFFDDDVPGFGLRVREGGSRSFVFQYKLGTKQRRMALGTATALNFSTTRKTAEQLYARVKLGQDPASDKAEGRLRAAETFIVAANQFLDTLRTRYRPRAFKEIERHLLKHAKSLHELQLAKIDRRDVATVLVAVTNAAGAVTGNRVRTSLNTFYGWVLNRGLAETNPVIGTEKNEEQSRERVLTPAELRLVWSAAGDDHYGSIIKLLALTGQREKEIGDLHRSEIHEAAILLPKERTKNKRPHVVPLSPAALAIIEAQEQRDDRDLIFGRGDGGFSGWSKSKERLDARIKAANGGKAIPHFTLHDLRRSFATYAGGGLPAHQLSKLSKPDQEMARGLEIQPHVIEAILNHVSGHKAGVAAIYQRGTYEREKRIALDLWADHLTAIVESRASNVTPLRREA
ncbi:MAG TPA: site-specific integrase [Xanthobacteraceae bacterium]|jgi:integrase|nr:site-specific integrase [Xanthobacteraceae bacterium]